MITEIKSLKTETVYQISAPRPGENAQACPECSPYRKNKKAKSFSWNNAKNSGYCQNCEAKFVPNKKFERVQYKQVNWNPGDIHPDHLAWLEKRRIDAKVISKMGVCSRYEWMPQTGNKELVISFPFRQNGKVVNAKHRTMDKMFKMESGAKKILYNADALSSQEVIIVEGEIDALSWIQYGFENVVSVPNGATTKNNNLEYLDHHFGQLEKVERFYIAVDNDEAGKKLEKELVRRLDDTKCLIVDFGKYKDTNEYICNGKGKYDLQDLLKNAKQPSIPGLYTVSNVKDDLLDFFKNGNKPGKKVGVDQLDELITWETSRVATFTGVPGHGKSDHVDDICVRLNWRHNWKVCYFSPENYPISRHISKIAAKFLGKQFKEGVCTQEDYDRATTYIEDNFAWVMPEEDFSPESILEVFKMHIRRSGCKIVVIDPWNKLEHKYRGPETQYISQLLDKFTNFAKRYDVLFILVAHPTKMNPDRPKPTPYDISGSANFYNKSDYCVTVYRQLSPDGKGLSNVVEILIQKVKFNYLGKTGTLEMIWNHRNGRYELADTIQGIDGWDNSNWLNPTQIQVENKMSTADLLNDIPF